MTPEAILGIGLTSIGMIAALVMWAIKATVAPLKTVIEYNTKVIEHVMGKIEDHGETLDEHGNRLTAIETVHRVRHGDGEG